jgi:hypothetical protein
MYQYYKPTENADIRLFFHGKIRAKIRVYRLVPKLRPPGQTLARGVRTYRYLLRHEGVLTLARWYIKEFARFPSRSLPHEAADVAWFSRAGWACRRALVGTLQTRRNERKRRFHSARRSVLPRLPLLQAGSGSSSFLSAISYFDIRHRSLTSAGNDVSKRLAHAGARRACTPCGALINNLRCAPSPATSPGLWGS